MGGVGWYGFGLIIEQSVNGFVSGDIGCNQQSCKHDDRGLLIISNVEVLDLQTAFAFHNTKLPYTVQVRWLACDKFNYTWI
jgi:hypothetical protein